MLLTLIGFPIGTMMVFVALIAIAMVIDAWLHKNHRQLSLKSALWWSLFWVLISVAFGGYLWVQHGAAAAEAFFTSYLLEKTLSVDNLFIIMVIFAWFKVPESLCHRVLFWGMAGVMMFRLIFVMVGVSLINLSPYMLILFAICIMLSASVMLRDSGNDADSDDSEEDYSEHLGYRLVHRWLPVFPHLYGKYFFIKGKKLENARAIYPEVRLIPAGTDPKQPKLNPFKRIKKGASVATSLFVCMATIELTDAMFAFDSVPAVVAVSRDPMIAYSAMILATLGLRSMYFVLENAKPYLIHIEKALIILLFFIAFKLIFSASNYIFHHGWEISTTATLMVTLLVLTSSIVASIIFPEKQ